MNLRSGNPEEPDVPAAIRDLFRRGPSGSLSVNRPMGSTAKAEIGRRT